MGRGTLDAAVAAALTETPTEGTELEGSETSEGQETVTPDASAGEQPETDPETTETPSEAPEGTDDLPDSYFGFDLSGFDAEQRASIIGELKKRDDHIGKLLREREPEDPAAKPVETEQPPAPEELTDEAILQAMNLDPENPLDEVAAKVALPLVRRQLEQDRQLSQLMETIELQELDRTWRTALSSMEKEFGALPPEVTHDAVMEYAAENGIQNPMDAYWRIAGPGRAALSDAMAAASKAREQALAAKKKAAATTPPGSSQAPETVTLEEKTVKAATATAVRQAMSKLGLNFGSE